jgi:hypothetical protein
MTNYLKMKNYLIIILIALLSINLSSCTVYSTITTDNWIEYELPPSSIVSNGDVFFGGKLSDGNRFHVFADSSIDEDETYYYTMLRQDFGWRLKDSETWTGSQYSRREKMGCIYINPKRRASVYFWPKGTYSAFKVGFTAPSSPSKY